MAISEGLRTSLNQIRETSIQNGTLYHRQIDEILPTTDIGTFSAPLLSNPQLMNEFMDVLVQRIVYTQIVDYKLFNNPLRTLEGDNIPLGSIGQEIYINPAKGRKFNVDDFAGLLAKYEADVKVQYHHLNSDIQYPVTITRAKIKDAFVSWETLENFVNGITQSLYNGAYIDRYNMTKGLVTSAYLSNQVKVEVISELTTESLAKEFLTKARTMFLNMQAPSSDFNAWKQVGGYGRDILTWSNPEDIVFLLRNDIAGYLDVNVLAETFHLDRASLLGRIIYVNTFNEYDKDGNLIYDGSNIVGAMMDKSWFRIKTQEITMDEFYNANNRTWQMYLNDVRMYSYSLFANSVVFATKAPEVTITAMTYNQTTPVVISGIGKQEGLQVTTTPLPANSPEITYESSNANVFTVTPSTITPKTAIVTSVGAGTASLTATAGNVSTTVEITVEDAAAVSIQSKAKSKAKS